MIFRARLDISWSDLAFGACACLLPGRREAPEARIRGALPRGDEALVCLSVRSGFDVLLEALALPAGSEVLLSAVTIPDMARIVRARGLVPVPVDVDPETLAPTQASLEAAASERSRVMVAAHLFGAVSDLDGARAFARQQGILFVEDCAQSYLPGRFLGGDESDVRMLSFGPIKTDTALGGGVLFVRDAALRARMREIQGRRPVQTRTAHARRVLKYGFLQLLASTPLFGVFRAGCRVAGRDFDTVLRHLAKGFAGDEALRRIRMQPSTPLLALLARRLERRNRRVDARALSGRALDAALPASVPRPGTRVGLHTHWVFPVLVGDPDALMRHLRGLGFDATSGTSSLTAVGPSPERPGVGAPRAGALMAQVLFLPAYPEIPPRELERLGRAVGEWARSGPAGAPGRLPARSAGG